MRRGIEMLAFLLSQEEDDSVTLGQLAEKYGEDTWRIRDALDVLKIIQHEPTQIPPVPWEFPYSV